MFKTLAYRLAEVKAKRVSDMLDHVKAKALVNKFPATLPEMKACHSSRDEGLDNWRHTA